MLCLGSRCYYKHLIFHSRCVTEKFTRKPVSGTWILSEHTGRAYQSNDSWQHSEKSEESPTSLAPADFQRLDLSKTSSASFLTFSMDSIHCLFLPDITGHLLNEVISSTIKGIVVMSKAYDCQHLNVIWIVERREIRRPVISTGQFSFLNAHPFSALHFISKCFNLFCIFRIQIKIKL